MTKGRLRMTIWYVLEIVIVTTLMLTNDRVDHTRHFERVQPFLAMAVLFYLITFVLVVRHTSPPGTPWWRHIDPFTAVMVLASISVAAYYTAIYGGFSERFAVAEDVYSAIRIVSWVAGLLGVPIVLELAISAVTARRVNRRKRMTIYDLPDKQSGG